MRDLAETKYETKDIDRRYYRLFGTLHPQYAAQLAAVLSFMMYLGTLVYICSTGYWYVFTTVFLAIVCCVEFLFGVSHRQKQPLESFITFAFIFHFALTGFIGVFIYFILATEENQAEYETVVVFQALFFILNAICISWMISFSKFVDAFNAKMAQEPIFRSSSDESSLPAKQSIRTNNSNRSEIQSENSNNSASSGRPSTSGSADQQRHSTTSSSTAAANRDTKIIDPASDTKIMDSTIEDKPPIRTSSISSDSRAAAAAHRTTATASTNAQRSEQPNANAEFDYLKAVFGD